MKIKKINSKNDDEIEAYGTNYLMVLQLIFLTLKIAGLVSWSWWFVFLPLIIEIIFVIVVTVIAVVFLD